MEEKCTANDHMVLDLHFYCKTCEELLCKKCYRSHPAAHDSNVVSIDEYMLNEKTDLEGRLEHVKLFIEEINKQLSRAQDLKEQIKDARHICADSVQSFDSVVKGLEEWRMHILENVDGMRRKEQEVASSNTNSDIKGVFKKPLLLHRGSVSDTCLKLAPVFIADRIKKDQYSLPRPASLSVILQSSQSQSPDPRRASLQPRPVPPPPLPSSNRPTASSDYNNILAVPYEIPPRPPSHAPPMLPSPRGSIKGSLNLIKPADQKKEQVDHDDECMYGVTAGFTGTVPSDQQGGTTLGTFGTGEQLYNQDAYDDVTRHRPVQDLQGDRQSVKRMSLNSEVDNQSVRESKVAPEELIYESMEEVESTHSHTELDSQIYQPLYIEPPSAQDTRVYQPLHIPHIPKCTIISNMFTEGVTFSDVCTNSDGFIIAANLIKSCLEIFDGNNYCGKINITDGCPTAVGFREAHSKSNSSVLVTGDFGSCSILKLEITEKFQEKPKSLKLLSGIPSAIAVSNQCKVKSNHSCFYVVTTQLKSGVTNTEIRCLKCNGNSNGTLSSDIVGKNPVAIGYQDGYLVVCDGEEGCLVKISTTTGKPVWNEGVDARRKGIMKKPRGIAILPRGLIAVSDSEAHTVNIFTADGALKQVIGKEGGNIGEFRKPTALAVRNHSELVVVDSLNYRLQILNMDYILNTDTTAAFYGPVEEYSNQELYSNPSDIINPI